MTRSTGLPSHRPRRGRALVVGRSPGLDQIRRRMIEPIETANLFDAIGELTTAPTTDPITAVFVSADVAGSIGGRGIGALRNIDPAVTIVRVLEPGDQRDAEAEQVYDACLVAPIDADAIASVVEIELRDDDPIGMPADDAPVVEGTVAAPPSDTSRSETLRALGELPATEDQPASTEELGDTDLVRAIMHDPAGLLDTALRLARRQSGFADLELVDATHAAASDGVCTAEVRYGDRCFGELRSAAASVALLQPWADWLALWLALDRSHREHRLLAYRDDLTGAWNRRFFQAFLAESIQHANHRREPVTVMVFDIDDFKRYNDEYGHDAGDVILIEAVRLLNSVIRQGDRVCRIGGDEFAVIFADPEGPRELGSRHPQNVEQMATRFQAQISTMRFPKLGIDAPGRLSISGGLATYPWDGTDPETLLRHADQLALRSKRSGKNVITFGPE